MPFIVKSHVEEYFFYGLFIDDDSDSIRDVAEYVLYDLIFNQKCEPDFAKLFVLPMKDETFKCKEFG